MSSTIGQVIGISAGTVTPSEVFTSDRLGIELELENVQNRPSMAYWNVTEDGSLRNYGAEFVLRGGMGGLELENAIMELFGWLSDGNYEANWRCSTHFHVDMLDFTFDQVAKFILLYATKESELFALSDVNRKYSNFCVPICDSIPFHKRLMGGIKTLTRTPSLGQKYTALNVLPLLTQGTLEYRGAGPITNREQMIAMINTLQGMKATVRASGEATAEEFLNGLVQEYTPDVANAYSLLKSYVEGPPPQMPMPSFMENGRATAGTGTIGLMSLFERFLRDARQRGTLEAGEGMMHAVSVSTMTRFNPSPGRLSVTHIPTWESIREIYWGDGLGSYERNIILRGLQARGDATMAELWAKYFTVSVRTKRRSEWHGSVPLEPVMTCNELFRRGVPTAFMWSCDVYKFEEWMQVKATLRANGKKIPMYIDGEWTL